MRWHDAARQALGSATAQALPEEVHLAAASGTAPQAARATAPRTFSQRPTVQAVSTGLDRLTIHTLTLPGGRRAVLEAPAYRTLPRAPLDLIRYRGTAYDRRAGDTVPSPAPTGYAGATGAPEDEDAQAVGSGAPTRLSERASGLPAPHGPSGWVVAHHRDDGHVTVRCFDRAGSSPTTWGTSTRSLLGLRRNLAQETRLWRLGDQVVWLRQEHRPASAALVRGQEDGTWPQAVVSELFDAALCTVMLGPRPLPGLPSGVVVLLEAQEAQGAAGARKTAGRTPGTLGAPEAPVPPGTLLLGLAGSPRELHAFLHEDHVPHHLVTLAYDGACSPSLVSSLVGDLPRGSVAHRALGDRTTVVFTERLEATTTSYLVEDGSVLASVGDRVDHYTGVPGLSGAWVEHGAPHVLRWATGSWSDGSPVTGIQEDADGVVMVMTQDGQGHQDVPLTPGASQVRPVVRDDPPAPPGAPDHTPVLWCPAAHDPVAGQRGLLLERREAGHVVQVATSREAGGAAPLVWFDDVGDLPLGPAGSRGVRREVDLGSLPVGEVVWCHAGSRPVVRVGIDYHLLAGLEPEDVLAELHQAWWAAVRAARDELGTAPEEGQQTTPFLGGHSFGAALAAVAVLHGTCSPAGALLRSGAYDRYTTPHGFEHDHRTAASHPGLYRMMSVLPRAGAHQGTPFLLTCGGSDQNSATTPQQSLALHENLLAAQADTTLAVFPDEEHVFSSRQAVLERRRLEEEWMRARPPATETARTIQLDQPAQPHDRTQPAERKSQP